MKLAFIGCGSAGRPLAIAWQRTGHEIGAVLCRSRASAEEAVRVIGGGTPDGDAREADAVVFATPDDAIASAAGKHALRPEQVAFHLSGAYASTLLEPTGAKVASLHPLCAFVDVESALAKLPQTFFFVEGGPGAVEVAEQLARDLGENVARIETDRKMLYHVGATIASNYVVTLLSVARDLFAEAGVAPDQALAALTRLALGAVENVGRVGVPEALTGPAARGEVDLVATHLDALRGERRELYRRLLAATLPLVEAKGAEPDALAALRALSER